MRLNDWAKSAIKFIAVVGILYGMYWLFKTVSYEVFYADMVEDTVRSMIKPEYIKNILNRED